MANIEELRKKSDRDCQAHLSALLKEPVVAEPFSEESSWHPVELRELYDRSFVLWRKCSEFEVILDEAGIAIGFVDEDKWQNCAWQPVRRERVLELACATGFVPEGAKVASMGRGPKDCMQAVLRAEGSDGHSRRYVVRVNPARDRLISLYPEEVEP